jgi:hypothetical protein
VADAQAVIASFGGHVASGPDPKYLFVFWSVVDHAQRRVAPNGEGTRHTEPLLPGPALNAVIPPGADDRVVDPEPKKFVDVRVAVGRDQGRSPSDAAGKCDGGLALPLAATHEIVAPVADDVTVGSHPKNFFVLRGVVDRSKRRFGAGGTGKRDRRWRGLPAAVVSTVIAPVGADVPVGANPKSSST